MVRGVAVGYVDSQSFLVESSSFSVKSYVDNCRTGPWHYSTAGRYCVLGNFNRRNFFGFGWFFLRLLFAVSAGFGLFFGRSVFASAFKDLLSFVNYFENVEFKVKYSFVFDFERSVSAFTVLQRTEVHVSRRVDAVFAEHCVCSYYDRDFIALFATVAFSYLEFDVRGLFARVDFNFFLSFKSNLDLLALVGVQHSFTRLATEHVPGSFFLHQKVEVDVVDSLVGDGEALSCFIKDLNVSEVH
mmetsp:Transcript_644/g.1045  ORF Transcript_644/g.1045 Transcript_644/m.1045 type:complete len:243 (-) Transcript_644:1354-2082(-)